MRVLWRPLLVAIIAAGYFAVVNGQAGPLATAAQSGLIPPPTLLEKAGFASLVCFASAMSYALFGMPKNRRFTRTVKDLMETKGSGRRRRAIELAVVAIGGGITGYFLLLPSSGPAAISAGAMWYGAFYRLSHNDSETVRGHSSSKDGKNL